MSRLAVPNSTLVYRFDHIESFVLLEGECAAPRKPMLRIEGSGEDAALRITLPKSAEKTGEATIAIGLPPIAIHGHPEQLILDLRGDSSDGRLFLEAADARGWGLAYDFGIVDLGGRCRCAVDIAAPSECWGDCQDGGVARAIPPLQPHRLRIVQPRACEVLSVAIHSLHVTGAVRLGAPGLA